MTPTPTSTNVPEIMPETINSKPDFFDWFIMILVVSLSSAAIFFGFRRFIPIRWVLRWALLAFCGGLLVFIYLSIQIAMEVRRIDHFATPDIIVASFAGVLMGWVFGWMWYAGQNWQLRK